jgi:hypothetical protein
MGKMPAAGEVAPEFELTDSTGAPPVRRKVYIPRPSDFLRAIGSKTRR